MARRAKIIAAVIITLLWLLYATFISRAVIDLDVGRNVAAVLGFVSGIFAHRWWREKAR